MKEFKAIWIFIIVILIIAWLHIVKNRFVHVVLPGESWSSIASDYNVTIEDLEKCNQRNSSEMLYPGEQIQLPIDWNIVFSSPTEETINTTDSDSSEEYLFLHIVKDGETLSTIASRYNLTVQELLDVNPQITDPNLIHGGDCITIPNSAFEDIE